MAYTNLQTAIKNLDEVRVDSPNYDNFRENKDWLREAILIADTNLLMNNPKTRSLLNNDTEFFNELLLKEGYLYRFATEEQKKNNELFKKILEQEGSYYRYGTEEQRNDREIALIAVKNSSYLLLDEMSDKLRCDKEIVLAAVKRNGSDLEWASEECKCDKHIVLEALKSQGGAKRYMSLGLKVLCEGKDPIETIAREIKREEAEKLMAELTPKPKEQTSKKFKL